MNKEQETLLKEAQEQKGDFAPNPQTLFRRNNAALQTTMAKRRQQNELNAKMFPQPELV
jgi:hypothetical protein